MFQKGNKLGKGRPKLPPDAKKKISFTRYEFQKLAIELLHMDREQFKDKMSNPNANMLELAVGSVIKKGVEEGSEKHLNFLLEQTIGRVKETKVIELSGEVQLSPKQLRPSDIKRILAEDPFLQAKVIPYDESTDTYREPEPSELTDQRTRDTPSRVHGEIDQDRLGEERTNPSATDHSERGED